MSDQDLDALNRAVTSAIWKAEQEPSAEAWEEVARCEQALAEVLPDGAERRIAVRGVEAATQKAAGLRATHEETESIRRAGKAGLYHGSGEIEPCLVRHPEMLEGLDPDVSDGIMVDGSRVGEQTSAPPPAQDGELPFGERLMRFIHANQNLEGSILTSLGRIAAEVDHDAEGLRGELAGKQRALELVRTDLRRQVEEAVEAGRYAVKRPYRGPCGGGDQPLDVLDAEPFLEALGAIFGGRAKSPLRPRIVCLCGSTRFWRTFQTANLAETLAGRVVLSIGGAAGSNDDTFGHLGAEERTAIKTGLDELHLRKIDLSDEVLVLNVGGYIGESTSREIRYATATGKPIRYLEALATEHEPAHSRRERESSRNEDSTGRVEGVDR